MGGIWERLIKSVKTTLQAVLKEQLLTDVVLHTVFPEVENILNHQPLTDVYTKMMKLWLLLNLNLRSTETQGNFRVNGTYLRKQWSIPNKQTLEEMIDEVDLMKVNDVFIIFLLAIHDWKLLSQPFFLAAMALS